MLLHGGYGDSRDWTAPARLARRRIRRHRLGRPRLRRIRRPAPDWTLADYADAVADLVAALGLPSVHLCGLSFGGGLALAVYQRHPESVRSLLLVSAYAGWKGSLSAEEVAARLERIRAEVAEPPST